MPKTISPGTAPVGDKHFVADALPDVFDARDLDYRPRLQPLPPSTDRSKDNRHVREQVGSSCTGHALAAVIDAVVATQPEPFRVSAGMLYWFARRYDEFENETDVGSSLRGALKAWLHHGVLPDEHWQADDDEAAAALGLRAETDPKVVNLAQRCPLGAFYRVNVLHLDDMQSAINELSGVVASAAIHDGWLEPAADDEAAYVIRRSDQAMGIGGHAFAVVGYNDVGFQVQNSWGSDWGGGGFATLPYDDWLDSAYDAWVVRPGVPRQRTQRGRTTTVFGGGIARRVVEQAGVEQERLVPHVVNLGNDGALSTSGGFSSNQAQLDQIFTTMRAKHDQWDERHVVLYAHGGLTSETSGLAVAGKHLDWWLRNEVYPVTFAWETGVQETFRHILADLVTDRLPFGFSAASLLGDLVERLDRLVESTARRVTRPLWEQMKGNAVQAAEPGKGATLTIDRLKSYVGDHENTQVHVVGHSAGAIFAIGVLKLLAAAGIPVVSLAYLAPAIRTDTFLDEVLPLLRHADGTTPRFVSFAMTDEAELDDICEAGGFTFYRKSLLYLVSRALEVPSTRDAPEVPLVGMQLFESTTIDNTNLRDAVAAIGGNLVWAPHTAPDDSRSRSSSHGGFDDDSYTMTSVLMRILGRSDADDVSEYRR